MSFGDSESIIWFMRGMAIVRHVHDLGLATLEQAGTVCGRQDADFGGDGTQIGDATAIHADALVDDTAAHSFLLSERTASLTMPFWPANSPGSSLVPHSSAMISAVTASVAALRSDLIGDR